MPRNLLVGLLLLSLTACGIAPQSHRDISLAKTHTLDDDPLAALVEFQWRQEDSRWASFCRGVTTTSGTATVQHCISDADDRLRLQQELRLHNPYGDVALTRGDLPLVEGPAFARTDSGSRGLDFVLIAARAVGPTASIRRRLFPTAILTPPLPVSIGYDRGKPAKCKLISICGSHIHYSCGGGGTQAGWSGSPVFTDLPSGRVLLGLHDQIATSQDSFAISWNTVLGRIRALRSDDLADKIGQQSAFNHRWTPGKCASDDPTPPIRATQLTRLFASGLVARDATSFWIYDNDGMCKVTIVNPAMNRCGSFTFGLPSGVNRVQGIGGDRLVIMFGKTISSENSTVVVSTPINDGDGLRYTDSRVIATDVGGVYASASYDGQLILGGEAGFCIVRGTECRRAHNTRFHVNDITRLPDGRIAAVGRYRVGRSETVGYCMTAELRTDELGDFRSCQKVVSASALRSPVTFRNSVLVASSEGAIYALGSSGDFKQVSIPQLPGDGIEDAVRSMAQVGDDTLAITGSDGSVRLLRAAGPTGLAFTASPDRAVFDRAIWLTDMLVGPGWILVRGQDNQIHKIIGF